MKMWRHGVAGALGAVGLGLWAACGVAATVTGKVVGPGGRPLADVQVFGRLRQNYASMQGMRMSGAPARRVAISVGLLSARTSRAGQFVLTTPPGFDAGGVSGDLIAYKPGFGLAVADLHVGQNELHLVGANAIRGRVVDEHGAGVAGAPVRLT